MRIICCFLIISSLFFYTSCQNLSGTQMISSSSISSDRGDSSAAKEKSLNEILSNLETDSYTFEILNSAIIETSAAGETVLGNEYTKEIVFEGTINTSNIVAIGYGVGAIQASGDGKLIFKNLTINDQTKFSSDYHQGYLEFGGDLYFENCIFTDSIYLKDDAKAEFVNCQFNAPKPNRYAVWLADGEGIFQNCTFTGYRGFKTHEESGMDVTSIYFESCTFENISEKPGIAIGTMSVNTSELIISIKDCTFFNCRQYDAVGSLEGTDGFYESDTPTNIFIFTVENTFVNGEERNF